MILPDLAITETIDEVIVYHADGLQVGIYDGRTNKTESATLQVLAEGIGFERSRRNLSHGLPEVKRIMSEPQTPKVDAVVIGAGFGGIYMLHTLRNELGLKALRLRRGRRSRRHLALE